MRRSCRLPLLQILTFKLRKPRLRLRGRRSGPRFEDGTVALLAQDDAQFGMLTVREVLEFSARLRVPDGADAAAAAARRAARVDGVIAELGLASAPNTGENGVASGGESEDEKAACGGGGHIDGTAKAIPSRTAYHSCSVPPLAQCRLRTPDGSGPEPPPTPTPTPTPPESIEHAHCSEGTTTTGHEMQILERATMAMQENGFQAKTRCSIVDQGPVSD